MAVYPDSVKLWIYVNGAWSDVTTDVIAEDKITGYWGLRSNKELDRVADVGAMYFTLDNTAGKYAPNLVTVMAGWGKGVPVKLVITYRGRAHIKFYGVVDALKITGGALGLRRVYVTVKDWLDYAAKYPLVNPGYATNQRADQALTTIANAMPIQPQARSFSVGDETFPTVFDSVTTTTRASTEFTKLALSEMGYIYLRKDFATGETLTFDQRTHRKGTDTLTTYSVPAADSGFLLKEDASYLLLETGDKLITESADSLTIGLNNNMQDIGVDYGNNVINRMTVTAYPRRVDTSAAVLYSIGYPMQIGAGQIITFRGGYFDPTGGATVNGVSGTMIAPVVTTDYLMNDVADGSGTDRSASLTVVAVYGTEGVTYTLTNGYTATCYITKLQARGFGVYTYAQILSSVEDSPSVASYGYYSETLNQMYQQNTQLGTNQGAKILDIERQPRTKLNTIELQANKTTDLLYGFLVYDIGDLVSIKEDTSGINGYYYIQAVHFDIDAAAIGGLPTGIINYGWLVKESQSISAYIGTGATQSGYSMVASEFSRFVGDNTKSSFIDFGVIQKINDIPEKSISFWMNSTVDGSNGGGYVFGWGNGSGTSGRCILSYWGSGAAPSNHSFTFFTTGSWYGNTASITSYNTWVHVVVIKSNIVMNTPPIFYVNGSVIATTAPIIPETTMPNETGSRFYIGAVADGTYLPQLSMNAKIKDFRIYNTILTAAQVSGIYNEGAGGTGYLSNLQLQAPVVKTSELTYYTDHTMLSTDRVIDNIYGNIGKPVLGNAAWTYPTIRLP